MLLSVFLSIPLAIANPHYETGRSLLGEKNSTAAIQAFEQCIAETAKTDPVSMDCHWEMGWAYWLKNDWSNVIKHWEIVKKPTGPSGFESIFESSTSPYWPEGTVGERSK